MLPVPTTCPFCACGCGFYLLANQGRTGGRGAERNPSGVPGKALRQGVERP